MINEKYLKSEKISEIKLIYRGNEPFPNICFDDFFDEIYLKKVLKEFPDLSKLDNKIYYNNPNEIKLATKGAKQFGNYTLQLVNYLNSEPFLLYLQQITGIEETLIPDPYFEGGGFHEIKRDGLLKIHVDFHKHRKMKLHRRLNLLIYLNEDWREEYGGHFELWEKDMSKCVKKILPIFNRVAIFSTTGNSWHGHPTPLNCPNNKSRKSLALYYYTNGRPFNEISEKDKNRITTTFNARKGEDSIRMIFYNKILSLLHYILPSKIIEILKSYRNK